MAYRILWASPFNLHDTSSGAAIEVRCLLENLAARGIEVTALSGFIFDNPSGGSFFPKLEEELAAQPDIQFFDQHYEGINYLYMRTASWNISALTDHEQRVFFARYCALLRAFTPDMIIMYGGGMLEMAVRSEARRRGIPVVYSLCNGNHGGYSFPDVDLIITASRATAQLYATRDHIHVLPTGPFIRPERVLAETREPRYITFVNPVPEKGVGLVARIAHMARTRLPDAEFLVVRSRGDWAPSVQALKTGDQPMPLTDFTNVSITDHTMDMRSIYAASKVLLMPSLWFEAFGMVATEACMNGIPVLATRRGGLPEAVGEGGMLFDVPTCCAEDYLVAPSEADMEPWLEGLAAMLHDEESLRRWSEKAGTAAEQHSMIRSTDRALELFTPLLTRKASQHPQLYRSGANLS